MLAPRQGLFIVSCPVSEEVHKKLGGSMVRTPDQTGQRCSISQNAQYIKWRSYLEGHWVPIGDGLAIGQRVVSNYIVHHSFKKNFEFYLSLFLICLFIAIITFIIFYFISSIKLLLSQPCGFTFFWFSSWSHWGGKQGVREQLRGT